MAVVTGVNINNAPGVSFDGVHSSTYGIYLGKSPFLLLPELNNYFETIPGREGVLDYGSNYQQREIVLSCMVLAVSEQDLKEKSRAIAAWLDPAKGLKRLIFDTEPDKFYLARVTRGVQVEQIAKQGRFEVTFTAPDPYAANPDMPDKKEDGLTPNVLAVIAKSANASILRTKRFKLFYFAHNIIEYSQFLVKCKRQNALYFLVWWIYQSLCYYSIKQRDYLV